MTLRPNSFAFCGGAYGDEGKGRIVDKFVSDNTKKSQVIVYRDNGGANAGHTVELDNGQRIAFHQLPSGVFCDNTTVVLGKGMVIHPGDLLEEIRQVNQALAGKHTLNILIDEQAVLSLDTHRAFEAVLKEWEEGGKGSTGRGISPAYADILLRHPIRMKDIVSGNAEKLKKHYALYEALVKGLGKDLKELSVPSLTGSEGVAVGSETEFLARLQEQSRQLKDYVQDIHHYLQSSWQNPEITFIFEKAQAIGLHPQWGVYPDVTASDTTFYGIHTASEGVIHPDAISIRAAVIKATYMSSVGSRVLPTKMEEALANRIREDANEYGATTKRPRGIAYLDLPALSFFSRVGMVNALVLTHMDIVYPDQPVKICVRYEINGKAVGYRPDQEFLNKVSPVYVELPSWDKVKTAQATRKEELPKEATDFLTFISSAMRIPVMMITTGPKREQGILFEDVPTDIVGEHDKTHSSYQFAFA